MKNRTKSTLRTTSVILCIVLMFGCLNAHASFLGPCISQAADLSANQTISNDEIVFPPNNFATLETASTTYYNNFVVSYKVAYSDVSSITFIIENSASATLSFFNSRYNDYITVQEMSETKLKVRYRPYGNDSSGTEIIRCAYYTTDTFSDFTDVVMHSVDMGQYIDGNYIMYNDNEAVTATKVYLGDINADASITDADILLLEDIVDGTVQPSFEQQIACDVNFDDEINSDDINLLNDRINNALYSFISTNSIVPISTPPPLSIDSDLYYRIKNTITDKYFQYNGLRLKTEPNDTGTTYSANFTINAGSGICAIKSSLDNSYLNLNADGTVSFVTNPINNSQFWYITPTSNGYYLVNYTQPNYIFSGSNSLSRDIDRNIWQFEEVQLELRYHYNYGYRYRYWKNMSDKSSIALTSSTVDNRIKQELNAHQMEIADIITTLYGVNVIPKYTGLLRSWEDTCYAPNANPTHAQMVAAIGENEIIDETADGNHDDGDACNCVSWNQCFDTESELFHHRNASKGLDVYASKKTNLTEHQIWLLTSGYEPCGNVDTNKDGEVDEHKYSTFAGLAVPWDFAAEVYHSSSSDNNNDGTSSWIRNNKNTIVALHEISHIIGALESETCLADSPHNLVNGLGRCVMSYDQDNAFLEAAYNDPDCYRQLYCDGCYNAIAEFLKYF